MFVATVTTFTHDFSLGECDGVTVTTTVVTAGTGRDTVEARLTDWLNAHQPAAASTQVTITELGEDSTPTGETRYALGSRIVLTPLS